MTLRPLHRIRKFQVLARQLFAAADYVLLDAGLLREAGRDILSFLWCGVFSRSCRAGLRGKPRRVGH
jgi:hypothetical protein